MANFSKISLHCPFRFVPNTATPGIHFDDSWACEQIKSFQRKAYYTQKWLRQTTTKIKMISTVAPDDLKVYDNTMAVLKSIAWVNVSGLSGYNVFEVTVDLSDKPTGNYWLYQKVELLSYKAERLYNEKAEAYITIMGLKAQANVLFAKSAEESAKALVAGTKDQTSFVDKTITGLKE